MKSTITLLALLLPLLCLSQNLPSEMNISEDGTHLTLGGNKTKGFYDEDHVHIIKMSFPFDSVIQKLELQNSDVLATVDIDGVVYDSVGIRIKGLTSRSSHPTKKSFNITLDAYKDQNIQGYETLNLHNGTEDPTFMREALYNHVGRYYNPSLKTNYAELYINGEYWGPYANVQQLNGEFIREWFQSNDGTRWRAINQSWVNPGNFDGNMNSIFGELPFDTSGFPLDGDTIFGELPFDTSDMAGFGSFFGAGTSTLNYLGADTAYHRHYQLKKTKKENPWADLAGGTQKLNQLPNDHTLYDSLKNYLDIDKSLWFLAHENIFTDDDGYLSKGGMDYYVYWEAETGRLVPLEYDGNSVMEPHTGFENFSKGEQDPFYRADDEKFPLANRLLGSPDLRQRYLAHYRVILEQFFTPSYLDQLIDNYAEKIRESVKNDIHRIHTDIEFEQGIIELKNYVRLRRDFLLNHPEISKKGLQISSVTTMTTAPKSEEDVKIIAVIEEPSSVYKARLYYAEGIMGVFTRVEMSLNSDGNFQAKIPPMPAGTNVRYYVEVMANDVESTVTFAPKGAEHDVYFYKVQRSREELQPSIVINELLASNKSTIMDSSGEYDDWVELYNTTDATIDLSGYYLSDNSNKLEHFIFPEGSSIKANDFLIVWADKDENQEGYHANFKISASGESIYLANRDKVIIDEISFGNQESDISFARTPNGSGDFALLSPTFGFNNDDQCFPPSKFSFQYRESLNRYHVRWNRITDAESYIVLIGYEGFPKSFAEVDVKRNKIVVAGRENRSIVMKIKSICGINDNSIFSKEFILKPHKFKAIFNKNDQKYILEDMPMIITEPAVDIFPNPAYEHININLENLEASSEITLYNLMGKSIMKKSISEKQTSCRLDISNLPSGTYIIAIESDGIALTREKIVKQRH